jgi:hypothetical protein
MVITPQWNANQLMTLKLDFIGAGGYHPQRPTGVREELAPSPEEHRSFRRNCCALTAAHIKESLEQIGCEDYTTALVTLAVCQNSLMLVSAAPNALLWPAAMLVWGPGYRSSKHQHHCVQLVMALKGELLVRSGPRRKWTKCRAILVFSFADG